MNYTYWRTVHHLRLSGKFSIGSQQRAIDANNDTNGKVPAVWVNTQSALL